MLVCWFLSFLEPFAVGLYHVSRVQSVILSANLIPSEIK